MPYTYGIKELNEGTYKTTFNIIYQYQHKYPSLTTKHNDARYKIGSFMELRRLLNFYHTSI